MGIWAGVTNAELSWKAAEVSAYGSTVWAPTQCTSSSNLSLHQIQRQNRSKGAARATRQIDVFQVLARVSRWLEQHCHILCDTVEELLSHWGYTSMFHCLMSLSTRKVIGQAMCIRGARGHESLIAQIVRWPAQPVVQGRGTGWCLASYCWRCHLSCCWTVVLPASASKATVLDSMLLILQC